MPRKKAEEKEPEEVFAICDYCGRELYPHADPAKMDAITVSQGYCYRCGAQNVTLIPVRDFRYASGHKGYLWD